MIHDCRFHVKTYFEYTVQFGETRILNSALKSKFLFGRKMVNDNSIITSA